MKTGFSILIAALIATSVLALFSQEAQAYSPAAYAPTTYSPTNLGGSGGTTQQDPERFSDCLRACFDRYKDDVKDCAEACEYCSKKLLGFICITTTISRECFDDCVGKAAEVFEACKEVCIEG